jgi:hypothetical protein
MWERAARHNPLSLTNYFYMDHRPFLPQDPTFNHLWRSQHSQYEEILLQLDDRILFLNNIQVADREKAKKLVHNYNLLSSCIRPVSLVFSIFMTGALLKKVKMPYKILRVLGFMGNYLLANALIKNTLNSFHTVNCLYFFQKYEHLTVDSVSNIKDPRRGYFKLDTSVYYRETADDIRGHGHHDGEHHHDHDTSTYYGPFPVRLCFNI